MSTQDLRPHLRHGRNTRQIKIMGVVFNVPAPSESTTQVDSSANLAGPNVQGHSGRSVPPPPIDVEALDEDVVISSPSAFEAAKSNARRARRRAPVVDLESDDGSTLNGGSRKERKVFYPARRIIICDSCAEKETPSVSQLPPPPPPPPPPPEPTFSCPVCMGSLVEEVTTKCGHIFCKKCILEAISAQNKCPTCRRKVGKKDIIRVYLPSTN